MREYALSLFATCALLGALSLIVYKKDGDATERFGMGVLLAAALILPLPGIIGAVGDSLSGGLPSVEIGEGEYLAVAEEAFSEGIRRAVCQKFSLAEDSVEVKVTGFILSEMRAEKIKITLSGVAALADYKAIESYLEGQSLGECEVRLDVG